MAIRDLTPNDDVYLDLNNTGDTINGLAGNDQITGGGGNDIINGDAGNDILAGGGGSDTLTGGTGTDIFRDTMAGLNGDHITDLSIGERIQITDLPTANFGFGPNSTITFGTNDSVTVDGLGPGRFISRPLAGGGFELRLQPDAHNDLNGSGSSDVLWRNDNGATTDWLSGANGGMTDNGANLSMNPGTNWQVAATGDFNGDGRVDVLWRDATGLTTDWLGQPNGGIADNGSNFSVNPGTQWQVAATGDFNGDGRTDILWQNSSGLVTEWIGQANGSFADNAATFSVNVGTHWHIAATGDFNGDGIDDLLWHNDSSGLTTDWLGRGDGTFADNAANFSVNTGSQWHIVGTGDFNGNGSADILWRNDSGLTTDWLSQTNGSFVDNAANFSVNPGTQWHVVQIGDFNGDGIDDLMWRNDNGATTNWLGQTNGGMVDNSSHFWINPGTTWHVQDPSVHDPFPFS